MRKFLSGECPNCGTRGLLHKGPAQAEGAPVLDSGAVVTAGDVVTVCAACGVVVKREKPASKKRAKSRPAPKGRARPQQSKRARSRSSTARRGTSK